MIANDHELTTTLERIRRLRARPSAKQLHFAWHGPTGSPRPLVTWRAPWSSARS